MSENQEASTSSTLTSGQHSYATTFKNGLYLLKKKTKLTHSQKPEQEEVGSR